MRSISCVLPWSCLPGESGVECELRGPGRPGSRRTACAARATDAARAVPRDQFRVPAPPFGTLARYRVQWNSHFPCCALPKLQQANRRFLTVRMSAGLDAAGGSQARSASLRSPGRGPRSVAGASTGTDSSVSPAASPSIGADAIRLRPPCAETAGVGRTESIGMATMRRRPRGLAAGANGLSSASTDRHQGEMRATNPGAPPRCPP